MRIAITFENGSRDRFVDDRGPPRRDSSAEPKRLVLASADPMLQVLAASTRINSLQWVCIATHVLYY